jgi:ubiquinone biosynthesis protein COQ4
MRRRPLQAVKALSRLIRNPEETAEVFVIMRALSGDALARGCARFEKTGVGRSLIESGRDIVPVLSDRAALARLPEGSLGRAYLALVERAGITADGLVMASEESAAEYEALTPTQGLYARRLRDTHDLWHTVTGYGTDPFGEVCVVAFSYAQTRNLGFAAIAAIGALKIARENRNPRVFGAVWRAYRDGKRATWLPAVEWERLLAMPLAEVRARLGNVAPTRYEALRNVVRFAPVAA